MKHIVYKTVNKLNGMYYIGIHNGTNDDYFGSGVGLLNAIKKYGKENFKREVLHTVDSREEALLIEQSMVNQEFVTRRDNYNQTTGGGAPPVHYGNKFNLGRKDSEEMRDRKRKSFAESKTHAIHNKNKSKETIEKFKKNRVGKGTGERNSMSNPEYVKKVSQAKIGTKKLKHPTLPSKMAFPGSEKWEELIKLGYG